MSGSRKVTARSRFMDSRIGHRFNKMAGSSVDFSYEQTVGKLQDYYRQVKRQILIHQSPTSGLFPSNLKEAPNEAHVKDSIYCAVAIWALAQAYKRIDDDGGRTYELSQSAVKCMRGILAAWMRQADKVEKFKTNQSPECALHSKFELHTGNTCTRDDEYEHLQIDSVALYLIYLVQLIRSGLQIIYTTDEVNFIQNLVYYVERAYRTPDFGMWERGSKYNNGSSELHASSIGMAKAALESINGDNLFSNNGAAWSVIYVDIDAHNRNRTIFDTILPRESASKNTDASLLPTISWPAHAIHDEGLKKRTLDKMLRKLQGNYGIKRFLRDGYATTIEDKNRRHYRPAEIKNFAGIESEWPIFFIFLIIDGVFKNDQEQVETYQELLKPLLKRTRDGMVVPKYYYIDKNNVEAERANPGSQPRFASSEGEDGSLFLWGQSVYIISQLLVEGLLHVNEIDPVRRYLPAADRPKVSSRYSSFQSSPSDLVIQCVLLAESVRLQQMLATYGIMTQTPHQVEPIQIWSPNELTRAYASLGVNKKLNLSGRPLRPIGGLGTAKIYRAGGRTILCYPLLFEISDFYLSQDMAVVIDNVKSDLSFLSKCWKLKGRPTFCLLIREENIRGPDTKLLFTMLAQFKRGMCDGIRVRLGRLQELIQSACIEHLDFLDMVDDIDLTFRPFSELEVGKTYKSLTDIPKMVKLSQEEEFDVEKMQHRSSWELCDYYRQTDSLYIHAMILHILLKREGALWRLDDITVEQRLERVCRRGGNHQHWLVVRFCSSLLRKLVDSLAPSITAMLVRGKQVTLGVFGHEEEVIDKPLSPDEIKNVLYCKCFPYDVSQAVLQQEMIINIGKLISTSPHLFEGILKIRIGWIIQAMKLELNYAEEKDVNIYRLPPSEVAALLYRVLKKVSPDKEHRSPIWRRQLDGALNRVPKDFYDRVWEILERTPGGLKVAGYHLPQQPTLSDMTMYELNFSLLVEQMLSKIVDPAYRQLMVETFMVVSTILERNPELLFHKAVDMDKLIKDAFDQFQKDASRTSEEEKRDDMSSFFNTPPNIKHGTTSYIAKAVVNTLLDGTLASSEDACSIS